MKIAFTALFFLLPSLLYAEGPSRQEFSFLSSFLQMVAALAIVIGLILLTKHFSSRFLGSSLPPRTSFRHIRLVETRYIAPKKTVILIEVGGEYLLLANTEEHLTLIKQVNIIEDIEVVEDKSPFKAGFTDLFRRNAGTVERKS
ncbi:MAG: hypothetical protein A2079_04310 [Geobacteraceae bacterium GWC2_48_7]|nr:MAG: hypothetical protein A2079_04310 [Geobacteraceae bacterium GWC2_48_7]